MEFDVITIFPEILKSYLAEAQIGRAIRKKLIKINIHNLRDYTSDRHKTTDDIPYGGGAGMIMKIEPIFKNIQALLKKQKKRSKTRIILLSAKGQLYNQKKATQLTKKYDRLIFICGRYEGVDERVAQKLVDEEISIGPYVLSGGELGALIIIDSVTRLLPGVLGNQASLKDESYNNDQTEYPQYTRPEKFQDWSVPKVLLSGNPKLISQWRKSKQKNFKTLIKE